MTAQEQEGANKRQLIVILVHGTWSTSERWTQDGSLFKQGLQAGLAARYRAIVHRTVRWSGKNRWSARERTATELAALIDTCRRGERGVPTEYLLIGHSHGGNIATQAARHRMEADPGFPLRGVVCLNTPFLKLELRASSQFLYVWMFVCLLVLVALGLATSYLKPVGAESLAIFNRLLHADLEPTTVMVIFGVFTALLALPTLMNRRLLRQRAQKPEPWGPRPKVLCLSSADDEAITLLGLGEGIANLPQLLFHPAALGVAVVGAAICLGTRPWTQMCPTDWSCWAVGSLAVGMTLASWIAVAIVGGLIGSVVLTVLFGLNWKMFVESLVTRVLVTYTPLAPADTAFRAIADPDIKWSPKGLMHSRIYRSRAAVGEMCEWVVRG